MEEKIDEIVTEVHSTFSKEQIAELISRLDDVYEKVEAD